VRLLLAIPLLLLIAACNGGSSEEAAPADVPEGFTRYDGGDFTFAYPAAWSTTVVEEVSDDGTASVAFSDGTTPVPSGVGFERSGTLPADGPSFSDYAEQVDTLSDVSLPERERLRFEPISVPGADDARLIEARYQWPDGDVTVRQVDVVAHQPEREQTPQLRISAPEDAWNEAVVQAIIDSLRLDA
jgi:hypothetical protein